jgi:hypothetical protein
MQTHQGTSLEMLRAARLFLDQHPDRLALVIASGSRRQLDQAIADLDALVLQQATGGTIVSGKRVIAQLRQDLIEKHMLPISRIASVDLPQIPELSDLAMPRGKPTPEKLVGAARAMGQKAESFAQIFIDAGMPADFLDELEHAATALATYAANRKARVAAGAKATLGIRATVSRAARVITAIDGLIRKVLDAHAPADRLMLAEWKSVKRVRNIGVRSTSLEPVPIPPAPAATPPVQTTGEEG